MFGVVRKQSMRSLEELEMEERLSSKIIKHDSLSIYEATLMKLKEGSRRDLSQIQEDPTRTETDSSTKISNNSADEATTTTENTRDSPADASANAGGDQKNRNVSVLYMFAKYKSSRQTLVSQEHEAMMIDDESSSSSSVSNSPSSEHYPLAPNSRRHLQDFELSLCYSDA